MTPNDKLPEEIREQITKDAETKYPCMNNSTIHGKNIERYRMGYQAGATAYAPWKVKYDDLRDQAQRMADALQRIIDNGEHEDYGSTNESCAVCIATQALQQFKEVDNE